MRKSQLAVIRRILLKGNRITAREAAIELDIYRLAALIFQIRRKDKVPVTTTIVKKNKNGKSLQYAEYKIPPAELKAQQERFCF